MVEQKRRQRAEGNEVSKIKVAECTCAVVAAVAAVFAGWQFYSAQTLQSETVAYQSWERFLEFAVENPEVSSSLRNYSDLSFEDQARYEKFVDRFLVSAEQILIAEPTDQEWQAALIAEARAHHSYLASEDFLPRDPIRARISGFCSYDKSVRTLIKSSFGYAARGTGYSRRFEAAEKNCNPIDPFE